MWTSRNRARYDRSKLRYPSDVTDEEWELMVPLIECWSHMSCHRGAKEYEQKCPETHRSGKTGKVA
jgi:hypothetical protein